MIDPKRLELGMYEDIPHLLTPVVVDPKKAANALRWAVREMEERYKTLAAEGVRNIEQYNRNVRSDARGARTPTTSGERAEAAALHRRRHRRAGRPDDGGRQRGRGVDRAPRADGARRRHPPDPRHPAAVGRRHHRPHQGQPAVAHLVPRVVEGRLAHDPRRQRRRAAARPGRHALPAARPRRGSSASTARTSPSRRSRGWRASCASRASPIYDETITAEEKTGRPAASRSRRTTCTTRPRASSFRAGQASISYLQRRLRIGFSRAARLVDMMERDGVVSAGRRRQAARGPGGPRATSRKSMRS